MLDFLKDIFISFNQTSAERLKSPFLGAFVFTWLGFNWDSLAVLFFSKKDIELRIQYIFDNHDLGCFLLAPLSITAVICLILPELNKIFIKIQIKPIHEATTTTMLAKIALAEQQLQISEIEAKKKLAEKKEEREIEQGIQNIKTENIDLNFNIQSLQREVSKTIDLLNEERVSKSTIQNLYENEQEALKIISKELDTVKENNASLISQLNNANFQLSSANERINEEIKKGNELNAQLTLATANTNNKDSLIESLQKNINSHHNQLINLNRLLPNLFTLNANDIFSEIYIYTPAVDKLIKLSNEMATIVHNNHRDPSYNSSYQLSELIKMQRNDLYNSAQMPIIFGK